MGLSQPLSRWHILCISVCKSFEMKKLAILLLSLSPLLGLAQDKTEPVTVAQMLTDHNYIFSAETALPQQGRMQQLTSEFDLTVTPDTIISYLPYFGRAFVAPVNPGEGGIKFTSVDFTYKEVKKKKKRWEITIEPRDAGSVQQLFLTVFDNGTASLRVNDRNRQSISFNGRVVAGPPRTKKGF
jgi:hypothetical protein